MTGLAHVFDDRSADAPAHVGASRHSLALAGRAALHGLFLIIAVIVFTYVQDRTETITVALIGLVFASLRATTLASACAHRRAALLLENEIRSVRQAVAQEIPALTLPEAVLERSIAALSKQLYIEYVGLTALGALCLYHLAVAMLYGMAYQQLLELR